MWGYGSLGSGAGRSFVRRLAPIHDPGDFKMTGRLRNVLWFLLVLALASSAGAQPKPRDLWFSYLDGDQRYGYQRVEVVELPDGNYRYRIESRALIDLFGVQKQEMSTWRNYVVTRDLALISLESRSELMSGPITTQGKLHDGIFVLSTTFGGETEESKIEMTDRAILDVTLEDWLVSVPRDDDTSTRKILDQESWTLVDCTATRTERDTAGGSTWVVEMDHGPRSLTLRTGPDGFMREAIHRSPDLHIVRCTEEEAKEIDYLVMDGRELLTFPVGKEIAPPHRMSSLTVKLSWKEIPFEEFELEDRRQRMVEKEQSSDGDYTVVLRVSSPAAIEHEIAYPVTDGGFESALGESDFIKPDHAEIVKAARGVVKGQETALKAVRALSAWVHDHIEGMMIAETLSGPEVLACKKGKCTEYSTLFASLARAVGIPTRVALGERLVSGQWMGHMWNEAYVGEWVSVDASAGEVGESFALLKFIHSDTVDGTQPLRWKLTESLSIEVVDYEVKPSSLALKYRTGVENGAYTNVDFSCRLTSPVSTWKIEPKAGSGELMVRFRIPDHDKVAIHFVAFSLPPGIDPKLITDGRLRSFRSTDEDLEVLRNESREVNGAKAQTTRFNYRAPGGDGEAARYRVTEVVWGLGSFGYLLNLIAPEAGHDEALADFEKLVSSFEDLSN